MEGAYLAVFGYYVDCSIMGEVEQEFDAESREDAVAQAKEWAELEEKAESAAHKGSDIWMPLEQLYGPDGEECEVE